MDLGIRQIECYSHAFDYTYDRVQAYNVASLKSASEEGTVQIEQLCDHHSSLRTLRRIKHSFKLQQLSGRHQQSVYNLIDRIAARYAGRHVPSSGIFRPNVGQYRFHLTNGKTVNAAIDSQDSGDIGSPELLDWSDIYFKTNKWANRDYPAKVRPLANSNPLILNNISKLSEYRKSPKLRDLCCFVRVWGGANEIDGIEHNIRLIESVGRAKITRFLGAYLVAGDIGAIESRLTAQSIPTTRAPLKRDKLWGVSASSRINVIRLGMHDCIPWRMFDLLCMGAVVVLDQMPMTVWPQPLVAGENYVSLDCPPTNGDCFHSRYESIPELLEFTLSNQPLIDHIARANADYFDRYLAPKTFGENIISQVLLGQE